MGEQERRKFSRLPLELECEVKVVGDSERMYKGSAGSISFRGIFFKPSIPLKLGEECLVTLYIGDIKTSPSIRATAKAIHIGSNGIGFEFHNLAYTSFQHLKDLLVYKSEDPEQIEKEIETEDPPSEPQH